MRQYTIGWAVLWAVTSGCGAWAPPRERGGSEVLGARGGALELADGTSLVIPEGALRADTLITVSPSPRTSPDALGPAYLFEPEGLVFVAPVTLRLRYESDDPRAMRSVNVLTAPGPAGEFSRLRGSPSAPGHVEIQTTHFSIYVAAAGTAEVLASGENFPMDVAVRDDGVFWTNGGNADHELPKGEGFVMHVPLEGGQPTPLTPPQRDPRHVALAGQRVCWTNGGVDATLGGGVTGSALLDVPVGGGEPSVLAGDLGFANDVIQDEEALYFTDFDAGTVGRVALGGGAVEIVASGFGKPAFLAQAGDQLFFTAQGDGLVVQVAKAGGAPVALAEGQSEPRGVATDGAHVYWVNGGDGRVMRVPVGGGAPEPLALGLVRPRALVVADGFVFFTDVGDGTVRRVPSKGGEVEIVAHAQPVPIGIAEFGGDLYWTNNGNGVLSGALVRMAAEARARTEPPTARAQERPRAADPDPEEGVTG